MRLKRKTAIGIIIGICGVALTAWIILMLTVFGGDEKPASKKDEVVKEPVPEGLVRVWRPVELVRLEDGKEFVRTVCVYDGAGNRTNVRSEQEDYYYRADFTYDEKGRVVRFQDSGDNTFTFEYGAGSSKKASLTRPGTGEDGEPTIRGLYYEFDEQGRMISSDVIDFAMYYTYDVNGRTILTSSRWADGTEKEGICGECDEQGRLIRSWYNNGNIEKECRYDEDGTYVQVHDSDNPEIMESYTFDAVGRLTKYCYFDRSTSEPTSSSWGEPIIRGDLKYNAAGQLIWLQYYTWRERAITVREWTYNENNQCTEYVHSRVNNETGELSPMERVKREYDDQGRVVKETFDKLCDGYVPCSGANGTHSYTKEFTYDVNGCMALARETGKLELKGGDWETYSEETRITYAYYDVTPERAEWMMKYDSAITEATEPNYYGTPYGLAYEVKYGDMVDEHSMRNDDKWEFFSWLDLR